MLVSSSSINVAIVTVNAIAQGLWLTCTEPAAGIGLAVICDFVTAALTSARLTIPESTDGGDPALGRIGFSQAAAAPLSRSFRSRSQREAGYTDRHSRPACARRNRDNSGRRYRCESSPSRLDAFARVGFP